MEGLGEILLKRINYDQDILAQLNYLIRSNTCIQFTVAEDPIVSQILVLFSKGYEKLLKIIPDATASDDEVPSLSTCSSCSVAESKQIQNSFIYLFPLFKFPHLIRPLSTNVSLQLK